MPKGVFCPRQCWLMRYEKGSNLPTRRTLQRKLSRCRVTSISVTMDALLPQALRM